MIGDCRERSGRFANYQLPITNHLTIHRLSLSKILPQPFNAIRQHGIPVRPLEDVLDGVEMDLDISRYDTFTDLHGYRFQAFATDTGVGQLAHLEARHRAHARVEDRIRNAKDTGLGRFPSRQVNVNAAWLELALLANDLRDLVLDHLTAVEGVAHAQTSLIFERVRGRRPLG